MNIQSVIILALVVLLVLAVVRYLYRNKGRTCGCDDSGSSQCGNAGCQGCPHSKR